MLHLHTHSVYSYGYGISWVDDIAKREVELGGDKFCITDVNSLTACIKAADAASRLGVQYIAGMEAAIYAGEHDAGSVQAAISKILKRRGAKNASEADALELKALQAVPTANDHRAVLICIKGEALNNLIFCYNRMGENGLPEHLLPRQAVLDLGGDGVACILPKESDVSRLLEWGMMEEAKNALLEWKTAFGDLLAVAVEPGVPLPLLELAVQEGVALIATAPSYHTRKGDRADWRLYRNVMSADPVEWLPGNQHMLEEPEWANLVHASGTPERYIAEAMQTLQLWEGMMEPTTVPRAAGLGDRTAELRNLCRQGWERLRRGTPREQESWDRMQYELSVIEGKGFSEYFVKVLNIVKTARKMGIITGPARGSGGGCEVCYLIGITRVDPLQYGLYFERFLNPGRPGYPDIDLDFAAVPDPKDASIDMSGMDLSLGSRELLMQELVRSGEFQFAGYIQNEVRATTLVLFKMLAKWVGIPFAEANAITGKFPDKLAEKTYTGWLQEAITSMGFDWQDHWELVGQRIEFCYRLDKIPYNQGTAASGVIMVDDAQVHLPVHDGVVMWNGADLESWGYIKYDLLTVTTLDTVQHYFGINYDWNAVDDPKVWDLICTGDTDFVFQFGSPGMKRLIMDSQPRNINDLAELNALYRPGPIEAGFLEKYVQARKGEPMQLTEEEAEISKVLKGVFGEQHTGLMIFQEDVMRVCTECAGFTMTEADDIRKAMGKKKEAVLAAWEQPFVEHWSAGGDPHAVWGAMKGFAHYAFNKSHSVAYAIIAYATARIWLEDPYGMLEWFLNAGTKENFDAAISKIKSMNIPMTWPGLDGLGDHQYRILQGERNRVELMVPVECEVKYESPVQLLMDADHPGVGKLILQGVLDRLHPDRAALAALADAVMVKQKRVAVLMEPEGVHYQQLEPILQGLIACGAVQSVERQPDGSLQALVNRTNGKTVAVNFLNPQDPRVRANQVALDLKYFGAVRSGVLGDRPEIPHDALESGLQQVREGAIKNGRAKEAYQMMRKYLSRWMEVNLPYPRQRQFEGVLARLLDVRIYDRNIKVELQFNNCKDIFYVPLDYRNLLLSASKSKSAVLMLNMEYSPFINKRKECFVYDFDLTSIKLVERTV